MIQAAVMGWWVREWADYPTNARERRQVEALETGAVAAATEVVAVVATSSAWERWRAVRLQMQVAASGTEEVQCRMACKARLSAACRGWGVRSLLKHWTPFGDKANRAWMARDPWWKNPENALKREEQKRMLAAGLCWDELQRWHNEYRRKQVVVYIGEEERRWKGSVWR